MSFSKYWSRLTKATPELKSEETKLTITVANLKKQLKKAYENGTRDQAGVAKQFADISKPEPSVSDLFGGMFGNRDRYR